MDMSPYLKDQLHARVIWNLQVVGVSLETLSQSSKGIKSQVSKTVCFPGPVWVKWIELHSAVRMYSEGTRKKML